MYFIFDLDDTLLKTDKTVSQYTKNILKKCRSRGDIIIINTARDYYNTEAVAKEIEADFIIANGGAEIYKKDTLIISDMISTKMINDIIRDIKCETDLIGLTVQADYAYTADMEYANKREDARFFDFDLPFTKAASKILIATKNYELVHKIAIKYNMNLIRYYDSEWYRISKTTKATGLLELLNILNSNHKDKAPISIAFGDDSGDIEMLKTADIGVALKNSTSQVLEVINNVTEYSCDEDGCARYIDEHFLK